MISTRWLSGRDDLSDAWQIRKKVFIEEQNVPEEIERDKADFDAVHLVAYDGKEPVATGRYIRFSDGVSLGRIAVLKERRGCGFGDLVVRQLIRKAYNEGLKKQYIHSQISAQGFYERFGFSVCGQPYEEAGIPHISMVRQGDISGLC